MFHVPETFMTSFINAVAQSQGGLNITAVAKALGINISFGDLCRFNEVVCQAGPADAQLNWSAFLDNVSNVHFNQDQVMITGVNMRWTFNDNSGALVADYTLGNVTIGLNIMSQPEFA